MPCYKPLVAERKFSGGVRVLRAKGYCELDQGEFLIPCSQCIGCREDRARQWAVRCVHESRFQELQGLDSCFVTLTYADHNLPPDSQLSPDDHTEFVNKLKLRLWRKKRKMRYYMCGEYGEKFARPHFHYLIFGYAFPDRVHWKTHNGSDYYRSDELESIWRYGHAAIGNLTFETAAYTARYVNKKITGGMAKTHYVDDAGVEMHPEFARMSLKPGIGAQWFKKYGVQDCYNSGDFIVIEGKKYSVPRYYDSLLERLDVERLMEVKDERRKRAEQHAEDNTKERLAIREECHQIRRKKLKRGYENGTTTEPANTGS